MYLRHTKKRDISEDRDVTFTAWVMEAQPLDDLSKATCNGWVIRRGKDKKGNPLREAWGCIIGWQYDRDDLVMETEALAEQFRKNPLTEREVSVRRSRKYQEGEERFLTTCGQGSV